MSTLQQYNPLIGEVVTYDPWHNVGGSLVLGVSTWIRRRIDLSNTTPRGNESLTLSLGEDYRTYTTSLRMTGSMAILSLTAPETGLVIYLFPADKSLNDWLTYRVLMSPGAGGDATKYSGTVDQANGTNWVAFLGTSQPTSWADAFPRVAFDLTSQIAATQATAAASQTDLSALKAGTRAGLDGIWRDEFGEGFTNTVTDP